ncbi:MAG: hydroxymethylglutaryl-CoA lyase [Deltaproteobacteria bacterium]|nr:hydroxymethylglutaryl-CoA lyase [Deltaproteobacteria bacterium]
MPGAVTIHEVGPRDGLQNEPTVLDTPAKLRLIEALAGTGLGRIEVTSFVSPKWIPALADADEVARHVQAARGVAFSALVPNARGLERALSAGVSEVAVVVSASETHNRRNLNKTTGETMSHLGEIVAHALAHSMRVRGYVSTVWGCPYEGEVDPRRALGLARELADMGVHEISLGDTIGVGTVSQTRSILEMFLAELEPGRLALHMHDTRGTALANVLQGLEMGITTFDASVGGLGGCPYAPGAPGNLATEDLVHMLHGMGLETGVDLSRLVDAARLAESLVGHELPGKVHDLTPGRARSQWPPAAR